MLMWRGWAGIARVAPLLASIGWTRDWRQLTGDSFACVVAWCCYKQGGFWLGDIVGLYVSRPGRINGSGRFKGLRCRHQRFKDGTLQEGLRLENERATACGSVVLFSSIKPGYSYLVWCQDHRVMLWRMGAGTLDAGCTRMFQEG